MSAVNNNEGAIPVNETAEEIMQPISEEVKQQKVHAQHDVDDSLPWLPIDAGMGEEWKAAEQATSVAVLRLDDERARRAREIAEFRKEPDLVARIKAIRQAGGLEFPEVRSMQSGGMQVTRPIPSDYNLFIAFNALFGTELPERPHFDTFSGMALNHNGLEVDDVQDYTPLMAAMSSVQLEGLVLEKLKKVYKNWINSKQMNELEHHFKGKLPEWDGQARLGTLLIDLFKPFDTEMNREFGKYFWLSLYCRISYPGCFAPMALALFGAQGAGKSYMSTLICREVTGSPKSDAVALDLSRDHNPFLREITGASVIANVGEMVGFATADLNKMKDFMTKVNDRMDQKYEKTRTHARQWIVVMDGNKYEGLQRDDTGNRRFYPMFLAQQPDVNGQPAWDLNFTIDYEEFRFVEKFWQVMAECREWLEENGGLKGYEKFAAEVSQRVKAFNANERAMDRGTVHDPELEHAFIPGMLSCAKRTAVRKCEKYGTWVVMNFTDILKSVADNFTTTKAPQSNRLKTKLTALGGEEGKRSGVVYYFPYKTIAEFEAALTAGDDEVEEVGEVKPGVSRRDAY